MNIKKMSIKSMAGLALSALLLLANIPALSAQNEGEVDSRFLSEKRIFLWDVTISMVGATKHSSHIKDGKEVDNEQGHSRVNPDYKYNESPYTYYNKDNDIFDATRAQLLKMIDDIPEGDYEIEVITYTRNLLDSCRVNTSYAKDKELIKNWVMSNPKTIASAPTFTGSCLSNVITKHFNKGKINRVILLTDGFPDEKNYHEEVDLLENTIKGWDTRNKGTRYHNNRLVYVMLTDEAAQNEKFNKLLIDKDKDSNSGVEVLHPGESIAERLNFSLTGLSQSVYVNDFIQGGGLKGGVFALGCERKSGPVEKMKEIKCSFTTPDTSLLTIDDAVVSYKDGKLIIPFKFTGESRQYYLDNLAGKDGRVSVKCSVDPSCENVILEGSDKLVIEVVVKPEPRAIISLSTK